MHIIILNQSSQIQSICPMVKSSYTFRHDTRFWHPALDSCFNCSILFINFLYRLKSDPMYLPAMHDELVLHFKLISQAAFLFLPRSGKLYPILSPEVLLHKQMSIIIIFLKKRNSVFTPLNSKSRVVDCQYQRDKRLSLTFWKFVLPLVYFIFFHLAYHIFQTHNVELKH